MQKRVSLLLGWMVCLLGAVFYCYEYMLRIEPSVMLPELMRQFHITASSIGLVVALYYYAYTPMQLVVGILIDRFGTRLILTSALIACTVGSFLFGSSHLLYLAGAGRFLIGLGSAFAFVGVLKLAAEWLPKHHFALFAGFATALGMVGAMVGDVELTILVHKIGWRQTLHIGTVIGLVLIPFVWLLVRDTPQWKSQHRAVKISFGQALTSLWQMVKNKQMWYAGIIGCMLYLSLSVFGELWGIPFLQGVYNLTPHQAAFSCSLVFAGWLIGAPFNGWISDKSRTRKRPLIIGGMLAIIMISIIILKPFTITNSWLNVLLFLFGVFSSVQIICFAVSRENNPTKVAATSIAFTNLIVMFGGMVFQPLVGKILDLSWLGQLGGGIRIYPASSYQYALLLVPVGIFIAIILAFVMQETFTHHDLDEFDGQ